MKKGVSVVTCLKERQSIKNNFLNYTLITQDTVKDIDIIFFNDDECRFIHLPLNIPRGAPKK